MFFGTSASLHTPAIWCFPLFSTPLAVRGTFSACPQEGYYIFREMAPTSAEAADDEKNDEPRPLKGPNQWPSEELLPG